MSPRGWGGSAAAWWLALMVTLPVARVPVDALRAHGYLRVTVLACFALATVALIVLLVRLRMRSALSAPSAAVIFGLGATVFGATQALTSLEERLHVLEYGGLGVLLHLALASRLGYAAGLAVAAGLIDESVQGLLPGRYFDWKDVGLNVGSALLALLLTRHALRRGEPAALPSEV